MKIKLKLFFIITLASGIIGWPSLLKNPHSNHFALLVWSNSNLLAKTVEQFREILFLEETTVKELDQENIKYNSLNAVLSNDLSKLFKQVEKKFSKIDSSRESKLNKHDQKEVVGKRITKNKVNRKGNRTEIIKEKNLARHEVKNKADSVHPDGKNEYSMNSFSKEEINSTELIHHFGYEQKDHFFSDSFSWVKEFENVSHNLPVSVKIEKKENLNIQMKRTSNSTSIEETDIFSAENGFSLNLDPLKINIESENEVKELLTHDFKPVHLGKKKDDQESGQIGNVLGIQQELDEKISFQSANIDNKESTQPVRGETDDLVFFSYSAISGKDPKRGKNENEELAIEQSDTSINKTGKQIHSEYALDTLLAEHNSNHSLNLDLNIQNTNQENTHNGPRNENSLNPTSTLSSSNLNVTPNVAKVIQREIENFNNSKLSSKNVSSRKDITLGQLREKGKDTKRKTVGKSTFSNGDIDGENSKLIAEHESYFQKMNSVYPRHPRSVTMSPASVSNSEGLQGKMPNLSLVQGFLAQNKSKNSKTKLKIVAAELEKGIGEELSHFDFRPSYAFGEVRPDDGNGSIHFESNINASMNILSGSLFKSSYEVTNVDLSLEKNYVEYVIPLISSGSFEKFLNKYSLLGEGGHLLIELDESVEKIELEGERSFEKMFYLDEKWNVSKEPSSYRYAFFIGVRPGNNVLNFITIDDEKIKKVIFIEENEIFFEYNTFVDKKLSLFELFETNVFARIPSELNIRPEDIVYFNGDRKSKRRGINRYELSNLKVPLATRIYLEFLHLKDSIFVGSWNKSKLYIPNNDYIVQVFNTFNIENLSNQCMIQINLDRAGVEFVFDGRAKNGLNLKSFFLEKDGSFSEEMSERTNKIFILGDNEGVINARLDYIDGTTDFLKSFCSPDTYLIEQL